MNNVTYTRVDYQDDAAFLTAWKRGILLADEQWFIVNDVPGATKWDFKPDYDSIAKNVGVLSSTERAFLIAMYSFFNSTVAQQMATAHGLGSIGSIAACLDEPRRRVIADLIVSYSGW